jgi:hypothetical protein
MSQPAAVTELMGARLAYGLWASVPKSSNQENTPCDAPWRLTTDATKAAAIKAVRVIACRLNHAPSEAVAREAPRGPEKVAIFRESFPFLMLRLWISLRTQRGI